MGKKAEADSETERIIRKELRKLKEKKDTPSKRKDCQEIVV